MLKKFFLSCSALITTCALAVGQVAPITCDCTLVQNASFAQNINFGSITVTGTCVDNTNGFCLISGTVTFVFNPNPGYSLVSAAWGEPNTPASLPVGTTVFTPSFFRECTGKNAFVFGQMSVWDGAQVLYLNAFLQWLCFGAL